MSKSLQHRFHRIYYLTEFVISINSILRKYNSLNVGNSSVRFSLTGFGENVPNWQNDKIIAKC